MKLLTAESLPTTEDKFFALLRTWFPTVYDLKFLMRATKVLKGGLQEVADDLGVRHVYVLRLSGNTICISRSCESAPHIKLGPILS